MYITEWKWKIKRSVEDKGRNNFIDEAGKIGYPYGKKEIGSRLKCHFLMDSELNY